MKQALRFISAQCQGQIAYHLCNALLQNLTSYSVLCIVLHTSNLFYSSISVDWASLAKQWIHMKETNPEPPVTTVAGLPSAALVAPPPPPPPPPMASHPIPPPPTTHVQSVPPPPPPGVSAKDPLLETETEHHGEMDMEIEDDVQQQPMTSATQNGYTNGERFHGSLILCYSLNIFLLFSILVFVRNSLEKPILINAWTARFSIDV